MQVRKFEARSMKEALEMVKSQMGPDAVILAVKDMSKKFGLVGQGSVEITAAASEFTMQKKKFIESRLSDEKKDALNKIPAKHQKAIIDKYVNKHLERNSNEETSSSTRSNVSVARGPGYTTNRPRRYIDIDDEENTPTMELAPQVRKELMPQVRNEHVSVAPESKEVRALKAEIEELRKIVADFQKIPQSLVSGSSGGYPGGEYGLVFDVSYLYQKLVDVGIDARIAAEILTIAQDSIPALKIKNQALVEAWVARFILGQTKTVSSPTQGKVHCFIGPSGSGKTTHLIKLASHIAVKEKRKVAVITTDTAKVGAVDQMKIYAQILNVPFAVVRQQRDWQQMFSYFETVDTVLVDFAGLSMRNQTEMEMVRSLLPPAYMQARIHLVLSALTKDSDLLEFGRRYSVLGYQDAIFTSIDESVQHGVIYNFMDRFDVPLHSFGTGSRIPEDFEFASKERVLDLLMRIHQSQTEKTI